MDLLLMLAMSRHLNVSLGRSPTWPVCLSGGSMYGYIMTQAQSWTGVLRRHDGLAMTKTALTLTEFTGRMLTKFQSSATSGLFLTRSHSPCRRPSPLRRQSSRRLSLSSQHQQSFNASSCHQSFNTSSQHLCHRQPPIVEKRKRSEERRVGK